MKPWQVIARREFGQLAGGRTYLVITIIGALLIGGLAFAPSLLELLAGQEPAPDRLLVAAPETLFQELDRTSRAVAGSSRLVLEWVGTQLAEDRRAAMEDRLRAGQAGGLLEITPQAGSEPVEVRLVQAGTSSDLWRRVDGLVTPLVTSLRAQRLGLSPETVARLQEPVPVERQILETEEPDPVHATLTQALSYVLLLGLYMAIVLYGQAISTGVIQEKGTRVVELLAGATTPAQILTGKVVGIGGAGLLQFAVWVLVGLLFSLPQAAAGFASRLGLGDLDLSVRAIPVATLLYFALFFLLGYTLYALLYAAFASTVSRVEEANQALMIPVFMVIAGFMAAAVAWGVPEGRVAVIGSLIPFFAPFVLFTRLVLTPVPLWQILLGVGLTLATIVLVLLFAARAYRRNILRYRRVSLRELFTGRGERPV